MFVYVELMNKKYKFEISSEIDISSLKEQISKVVNQGAERIKIIFDGRILSDERTVEEYLIKEASIIKVVVKNFINKFENYKNKK